MRVHEMCRFVHVVNRQRLVFENFRGGILNRFDDYFWRKYFYLLCI